MNPPRSPIHPANETTSAVQRTRPSAMGWRVAFVAAVVSLATWAGWSSRPPSAPAAPTPPVTVPSAPRAEGTPPVTAATARAAAPRADADAPRVAAARPAPSPRAPRHADFAGADPTPAVRHVADWVVDSDDHQGRSFVIVDKQDARVWVFQPTGELLAHTPALLGKAVGDDAVPGIGEKPLKEITEEEKTTPAGRFIAEPGVNAGGEDVVWVSYDLAVSLHRVRPTVKAERRLERLASPTPDDNRISFGCINLPVAFYEDVLAPTVRTIGAVVYVLPETRTPQEQFGSYDVAARAHLAAARSDIRVK